MTPTTAQRSYRGVSASDRLAARRAALLDSALDVIGTSGVHAVTVEAVAAAAGLTKRYFYESFADRDALFEALIDGLLDTVRTRIRAALDVAGPGVEQRSRATVEVLVTFFEEDRRQARLYVEAPAHPVLHARREAGMDGYAELLTSEVLGADPTDPRVRLMGLLVVSGTTDALGRWLAGDIELDRAEVVDEIARIGVALTRR